MSWSHAGFRAPCPLQSENNPPHTLSQNSAERGSPTVRFGLQVWTLNGLGQRSCERQPIDRLGGPAPVERASGQSRHRPVGVARCPPEFQRYARAHAFAPSTPFARGPALIPHAKDAKARRGTTGTARGPMTATRRRQGSTHHILQPPNQSAERRRSPRARAGVKASTTATRPSGANGASMPCPHGVLSSEQSAHECVQRGE